MKKIELLAPAGNMESLKTAVSGGCDAVYLGLTTFSARAFAGNFTHEEFLEAITYCHLRNVKVYVTLNTMLYETEIKNAFKEVEFLYENDVDALLIQDLGLFDYVHMNYPDLEIHCSTQMHIHNIDGARFMKKQGASRIVVARETPLSIIQEMCKEDIEIEAFAYGALCISYSGQCLMSSAVKNRSGNRGMCAQLCRLKYHCNQEKEESYLLSPKDLNVIDHVPELIESGVASLKIEGRMKRKEYVYLVTKLFREAIDAYYEGKSYKLNEQDRKDLLLMFNRGFTQGHLFNKDVNDRMSHYRPNHQGIIIGKVLAFKNNRVSVKLSDTLYQNDGLRILNEPVDTGLTAVRIEKNGKLVSSAKAGDTVWLDCKAKPEPKKGQSLQKTTDVELLSRINQEIEQKQRLIDVKMSFECIPNEPMKVTITSKEGIQVSLASTQLVQNAKNAPLTKDRIITQLMKIDEYPFHIYEIDGTTEEAFLPVKEINQLRRELFQEFAKTYSKKHLRNHKHELKTRVLNTKDLPQFHFIVENGTCSKEKDVLYVSRNTKENSERIYTTIHENEYNNRQIHNAVISEVGALNLDLKHVITGMTFNCANSYAAAFLYAQKGVEGVILSSEMNHSQIELLLNAFKSHYGFMLPAYQLVYGRRTLMYIKDTFTNKNVHQIMDQHHNVFPIMQDEGFIKILEHETYHQDNRYCYGSYIIFTTEDVYQKREVEEEAYEELHERI